MSTVSDFILEAKACVGKDLSWCNTHFNTSFNNNWCAWFASECGKAAGMSFKYNTAASSISGSQGNKDIGTVTPKAGDLALISYGTTISHVGIIVKVDSSGNIYTVEGNLSGNGDYTASRVRNLEAENFPYPPSGISTHGFGKILKIGVN